MASFYGEQENENKFDEFVKMAKDHPQLLETVGCYHVIVYLPTFF